MRSERRDGRTLGSSTGLCLSLVSVSSPHSLTPHPLSTHILLTTHPVSPSPPGSAPK